MREWPAQKHGAGDWTQGWFQRYAGAAHRDVDARRLRRRRPRAAHKPKGGPTPKNALKARVISINVM
jgi:hypothetical protein